MSPREHHRLSRRTKHHKPYPPTRRSTCTMAGGTSTPAAIRVLSWRFGRAGPDRRLPLSDRGLGSHGSSTRRDQLAAHPAQRRRLCSVRREGGAAALTRCPETLGLRLWLSPCLVGARSALPVVQRARRSQVNWWISAPAAVGISLTSTHLVPRGRAPRDTGPPGDLTDVHGIRYVEPVRHILRERSRQVQILGGDASNPPSNRFE
jgi:hypothetical protein